MFTGIIEETGIVKKVKGADKGVVLEIEASKVLEETAPGDSIATNGVCLTVDNISGNRFTAYVMHETLSRTNLGTLKPGTRVNLERAMPACGRFGGHMVSGHIDGTGIISEKRNDGNAIWITVSAPSEILKYIVEKGSVAIDGISLTVAYVDDRVFKVSVIPHTQDKTTLVSKRTGESVNLENDVIAKYVEKMISFRENTAINKQKENSLTLEYLESCGF